VAKNVLVTGGCGFIGTNICEYFIKKGYKITAFDNLSRKGVYFNLEYLKKTYKDKFNFIWGDVRNSQDLDRLSGYDGIIHLAANPGIPRSIEQPIYDFEVNARGTLNVLEFSKNRGKIPIIFASTNKVYSDKVNEIALIEKEKRYVFAEGLFEKVYYDGATDLGFSEEFPIDGCGLHPHSPYGCSKYAGDVYCQEYYHVFGVPTVINRMSCIYGRHQFGVSEQGWLAWFCIAKFLNKPLIIYGDGKQVRDSLYGEDLAELYEMELNNIDIHAGNVYNIGGGIENSVSLLETIEYLDSLEPKKDKLSYTFEDWRPADHKVYISDISKISYFWQPKTDVLNGIELTYNWIKNNKDLWIN